MRSVRDSGGDALTYRSIPVTGHLEWRSGVFTFSAFEYYNCAASVYKAFPVRHGDEFNRPGVCLAQHRSPN